MSGEISTQQARDAVEAVLRGGAIGPRSRQRRLLRHIVEESVAGRADRLKAYAIGCDVFDRPDSFDPAADSVVRVEMARLRQSLAHHYRTEGADDPVIIGVPPGAYAPTFTRRAGGVDDTPAPATPAPATVAAAAAPRNPRRLMLAMVAGVALLAVALVGLWRGAEPARPDRVRLAIVADDAPASQAVAAAAQALASSFSHLALVGAPPRRPTPEDYRLEAQRAASGIAVSVTHARTDAVVAAEVLDAASVDGLAALLQTWGPVVSDYIQRGDFTPVTACLAAERRYFTRQTDARHAEARACAEDLIARGAQDPLIFQALARMHREEYSDGRNARPGDPLARGLEAARAAEALTPNDPGVQDTLLGIVQYMGLPNETRRIAERVIDLSPNDPSRLADVASRLAYAGDYERALTLAERSAELAPANDGGRDLARVLALLGLGRHAEAAAAAEALVGAANPLRLSVSAAAHALAGDAARAASTFAALTAVDPTFAANARVRYERRRFEPALVRDLLAGLEAAAKAAQAG